MSDDLSPEEVESISSGMGETPSNAPSGEEGGGGEGTASSNEPTVSRIQFMQLEEVARGASLPPADLERMFDVKVSVEVVLGSTRMPLSNILELHPGAVVELNKLAGEAVDITANGRVIAKAEVVVVDGNFGVKILEIVGTEQKLKAMQG